MRLMNHFLIGFTFEYLILNIVGGGQARKLVTSSILCQNTQHCIVVVIADPDEFLSFAANRT